MLTLGNLLTFSGLFAVSPGLEPRPLDWGCSVGPWDVQIIFTLLKYIHLHYVWHDIFPIWASAPLKPGKVKVRVTSSAGDHLGETWFECLDKTRDMFEKLKDDPNLLRLFFTLLNQHHTDTTPGLLLRCSILIVMMLILASSSTRYQ